MPVVQQCVLIAAHDCSLELLKGDLKIALRGGGGGDMNARRRRGGGVGEMDVRDRPLNKGQFCRFV